MDIKLENFIAPRNLETLRSVGLPKVAALRLGVEELSMAHVLGEIGRRVFLKRAEAHRIGEGIDAYAEMTGEKKGALERLLRPGSMAMPMLGAGMMAAPDLMREGPIDWDAAMKHGLIGAGAGALTGGVSRLEQTLKANPHVVEQLEGAMARGA